MAVGLYIQQSLESLNGQATSLTNHLDCQIGSKFTINSSTTAGSFTAPFFEADETSEGSWSTFSGVMKFTNPGTTTPWNRPNNTVHVTKFTIPYLIGSLWFRPQVDKTVCIIDINKDYINNQTIVTMLSSPNTSVDFFHTGVIPQVSGNYMEMYRYDSFNGQNEIIFNELGLKRSYKVREVATFYVDHRTGQQYSNTICNGSWANRLNYNPTNDRFTSSMTPDEYAKAYINTSSVYNYYNNSTGMRGVCVKFASNNAVYAKYWDRLSGINVTFLKQHVPPATFGTVDPNNSGSYVDAPISYYPLSAFLAYFPNVF